MDYNIREDFLYSIFKIIIHKIGNIANVFSVNIEAFLSSSVPEISKTFVYRMKEASLSLNSFIDFMRIFLSQNIDSIKDNDLWERIVSMIFLKNKNLSASKVLNIKQTFFRALFIVLTSISGCLKDIEEVGNKLIVKFFDKIDGEVISYLEKRGINYTKESDSICIFC